MRLVLVESPFACIVGTPEERRLGVLRNVTYARLACHDCYRRGEAAYASHLFYTQPHILDDDVAEERAFGIDAGLAWGKSAEASAFYIDLGVSRGMEYGRKNALAAGRPALMRSLPGWERSLEEAPAETLLRLGLCSPEDIELASKVAALAWSPRP